MQFSRRRYYHLINPSCVAPSSTLYCKCRTLLIGRKLPPPLLVYVNSFHVYVQFVGRLYDVHGAGEQDMLYLALDNAWHNDCAVRI